MTKPHRGYDLAKINELKSRLNLEQFRISLEFDKELTYGGQLANGIYLYKWTDKRNEENIDTENQEEIMHLRNSSKKCIY